MRKAVVGMTLALLLSVAFGGAPDDDGDGVPNDLDCRPNDGSIWAPPGQPITDLELSRSGSAALLRWTTPADPGGDPGRERYDTYGTHVADAFGHATGFCVELDSALLSASDDRVLWPEQVAYYLVRIENDCGRGPIDSVPRRAVPRELRYLVVDNTSDEGVGSLREAVDLALDGDAICIDATGTITLSGPLAIEKDIAIVGPGAALLSVTGASDAFDLLSLDGPLTALTGISIDGVGMAQDCVLMRGGNSIESTTIQDCGVGVLQPAGASESPASIRHSVIQNNRWGVRKLAGGILTVTSSTISNGSTGVYVRGSGPVTIRSSTIHSNSTGLDLETWNTPRHTIDSSTISDNSIGMYIADDTAVTITSSTISGNHYGIYFLEYYEESSWAFVSNTVLNNFKNCIDWYGYGIFRTEGHNIFSDDADDCSVDPDAGDRVNLDPLLGPLADNGGGTMTQLPLPGSSAIDAGSCPDQDRDQRGFPRPVDTPGIPDVDDACDIGAVEQQ